MKALEQDGKGYFSLTAVFILILDWFKFLDNELCTDPQQKSIILRDCHQISLLTLSEFKQIN